MQFYALLTAIMAMLSFAMADTITQTIESTTTITMTLTNYNATTTLYYNTTGITGTGGVTRTTTPTGYNSPTLSSGGAGPTSTGAAVAQQANFALAGLFGVAAMALAL